jgi:hypothetical protein
MTATGLSEMTAKDLAIGIHVLMKGNPDWHRFGNHKMSEDRKSLTITLPDEREFTVSVYPTDQPFDQDLLCTLIEWLTSTPELKPADIHDALVAYVDLWRNGS